MLFGINHDLIVAVLIWFGAIAVFMGLYGLFNLAVWAWEKVTGSKLEDKF